MISRCIHVTYLINDDPMTGSHMCSCHPSFELGSAGRTDEVPWFPSFHWKSESEVYLDEWKGVFTYFFNHIFITFQFACVSWYAPSKGFGIGSWLSTETGVFVDPQEESMMCCWLDHACFYCPTKIGFKHSNCQKTIIEYHWIIVNLYDSIHPRIFEIFQSRSFSVFSVKCLFSASQGQLVCSDFCRPFFVARVFFTPGPVWDFKKRHACGNTSSKCFLIFCKVELQFVEDIETNHQPMRFVSATCCMLENRHGSGGNRLGWFAPHLIDPPKFSWGVMDLTFGTGTPRVLTGLMQALTLKGLIKQTKQLHWKVHDSAKEVVILNINWIQLGGSAIRLWVTWKLR